jgi:hypothetical protein
MLVYRLRIAAWPLEAAAIVHHAWPLVCSSHAKSYMLLVDARFKAGALDKPLPQCQCLRFL